MRRPVVRALAALALASGCAVVFTGCSSPSAPGNAGPANAGGAPGERGGGRPAGGGGGGRGGMGGGMMGGFAGARPPMNVEVAPVSRADISARLTVVGNLVGAATVDVVPRTPGRVVAMNVQLGDRVSRGQVLARVEDQEIREQVKQAEASFKVAQATIRQREADLKFAETNLERSRNLYGRQLLPKQSLDDAEARYAAGAAQLDLARAQFAQSEARLEELRIALGNTSIVSPVNGFVGRRNVDPGAWASQNAPVVSVVDITTVRLVANVVEKDLRLVGAGDTADVAVDAFPGETFRGRIAHVAPVLDPATRTAAIEIEVPNPGFRLKPGMYARMAVTIDGRSGALVVPKAAVVDYDNARGVFTMTDEGKARFLPLEIGIDDGDRVEVRKGLADGQPIVVNGAASLRSNDTLVVAGQRGGARPGGPRGLNGGGRPGPPRGGPADGRR